MDRDSVWRVLDKENACNGAEVTTRSPKTARQRVNAELRWYVCGSNLEVTEMLKGGTAEDVVCRSCDLLER
jgi:hypothetical protein